MGANFTWTPTWVMPRVPQYAVLITQSESFKKDYQLLDSNSIDRYDLSFDGISDTDRNAVVGHYSGVTGPYDSFIWTTVPSYLNAGTTMTVRYVSGSYKEEPSARYWSIKLSFEKDV